MSSHHRQHLVSPTLALFVLAFSQMALAQATERPSGPGPLPPSNETAMMVAKELIGLMADRLEVADKVARFKWNEKLSNKESEHVYLDDEKVNAVLNESNAQIIKDSGVDASFAEAFLKAQMVAFKDHQTQRFASWTKEGVYEFDEEAEAIATLKSQLEKNLRDQLEKVAKLKALTSDSVLNDQVNELATNTFARRGLDKSLAKPLLVPFAVTPATASR